MHKVLLIAFDTPQQMQYQLGFGFPNCITACLDDVSVCIPGYLSPLPPSLYFLFMFESC